MEARGPGGVLGGPKVLESYVVAVGTPAKLSVYLELAEKSTSGPLGGLIQVRVGRLNTSEPTVAGG